MEELFLSILRQAITPDGTSGDTLSLSLSSEQLNAVASLAQRHGVAPLIYNELLKQPEGVNPEAVNYMRQVCVGTMMTQQRQLQVLTQTVKALQATEDKAATAVLLKGFSLAQLYPLPYLRAWGDLDIYVGPAYYHQAAAVLRETYPDAIHHDEEWEELKHYCFILPDGNVIEMHRRTMALTGKKDNEVFCPLEEQAMREPAFIDVNGLSVAIPEAKFNMLFVFMHAWEHFYESGVGLKQLSDVALLCQQSQGVEGMEAYLSNALTKLHLLEPWQLVGYFLHKALHLPKEQWWLYSDSRRIQRLGERFYKKVMQEGLMRHVLKEGELNRYQKREKAHQMNVLLRKMVTLYGRVQSTMPMLKVCPRYAWHHLLMQIKKGIHRTVHREKMLDY